MPTDIDPGAFTVAKYSAQDDQTTPGERHPEDETTNGAGRMMTRVDPNPKCNGCIHYRLNERLCTMALYPSSCGDGSKPETGYAPLVPNAQAYSDWRAKRGLQYSAPHSQADAGPDGSGAREPVGGPPGTPDFVVQVLGDEGHMELSQKPGDLSKGYRPPKQMNTKPVGAKQYVGYKAKAASSAAQHWSGKAHGTKHAPTHLRAGKMHAQAAFYAHNAGDAAGAKYHAAHATKHLSSAAKYGATGTRAVLAQMGKRLRGAPFMKKSGATLCKCGVAMKGEGCQKCGMKNTAAYSSEAMGERMGGPVQKALKWGAHAADAVTADAHHGTYAVHGAGSGRWGVSYRPKGAQSFTKLRSGVSRTTAEEHAERHHASQAKPPKLAKAGDPWAIAGAAWKKVSPEKKKKYVSQAMARHRKAGEKVHASKYEARAPREFMERVVKKGGVPFVEEFGHTLAGELYAARRDIIKSLTLVQPLAKSEGKGDKDNFGHGHFDYIGRGDKHVVVNHADGKPKGGHKKHKEKMKKIAAIVAEKGGTVLSNNPSDAEIAKALMAGGGAGALTLGGTVAPPSYVHPREDVLSALNYGLPSMGAPVTVQPEAPAPKKPKFPQTVGGVQSAAWDLGIFNGNE